MGFGFAVFTLPQRRGRFSLVWFGLGVAFFSSCKVLALVWFLVWFGVAF